jgi:hypothetical protein
VRISRLRLRDDRAGEERSQAGHTRYLICTLSAFRPRERLVATWPGPTASAGDPAPTPPPCRSWPPLRPPRPALGPCRPDCASLSSSRRASGLGGFGPGSPGLSLRPGLRPVVLSNNVRAASRGPAAYGKRLVRRKTYGKSMGATGSPRSCARRGSSASGADPRRCGVRPDASGCPAPGRSTGLLCRRGSRLVTPAFCWSFQTSSFSISRSWWPPPVIPAPPSSRRSPRCSRSWL